MKTNQKSNTTWGERVFVALLFTAIGFVIFYVFSPLRPEQDPIPDYLGRAILIVFLLLAAFLARRNAFFEAFAPVLVGLLIMAVAVSLDYIFAVYLIKELGVDGSTSIGFALQKLNECAVVVSAVVVLTKLSGGSLGSIYLQKGNLKLGLLIGGGAFLLAAAGSTLLADFLFKGQDLTLVRIVPWLPWIMIIVLANAMQEELLFRGLFLRKLQPFFGKFISNFLVVLVFTVLHRGVDYASNDFLFLAGTSLVALAWGSLMQKTDSIWGSVLFHAGMDIPIILGIISNW